AVPSLALGSGEVTLASLTAAYAAFADGGLVRKPVFIRRVEDSRGTLLFESLETASRATSPTTAFLMSAMLADVVNTGTASRSRQLGFTLPAAGKTGTTNDFHDAWFVGYTPTLVTGVWVGFDAPRTILRNGFAADVAVPLWTRFMSTAARGDTSAWFAPPPDVTTATICPVSGKRATSRCDQSRVEYFARGTEPAEDCDLHTAGPLRKLLALFGARGQ
ncbi:MAG: hypothetical protein HY047_21200, partial [Acidobacteria bacterium]|nr:hypothetical protein [Acidobacteriota bacterium]